MSKKKSAVKPHVINLKKGSARIGVSQHNLAMSPSEVFAHFGVKNPLDVQSYLHSKEATDAMGLLIHEMEVMDALKQNQKFETTLKKQKRRRLLLLILSLIAAHEVEADDYLEKLQIAAKIELQVKETLIQKQLQEELETYYADEKFEELFNLQLEEQYEMFKASESIVSEVLQSKLDESDLLIRLLQSIKNELSSINERYDSFEKALDSLNQSVLTSKDALENELSNIEQQLSSYANIVTKLLEEGHDEEARKNIQLSTALNVRAAQLRDIRAAKNDERNLYDINGESLGAEEFEKAHFIVPKDKALRVDQGKYYLLSRTQEQDFSQFTEKQKDKAYQDFLRSQQALINVREQLHYNKKQELARHEQKKSALSLRNEALQKDIHLLSNQLVNIQTVRLELEKRIALQPTESMTTPQQKVTLTQKEMRNAPQKTTVQQQLQPPSNTQQLQNLSKPSPQTEGLKIDYFARNAIITRCIACMESLVHFNPGSLNAKKLEERWGQDKTLLQKHQNLLDQTRKANKPAAQNPNNATTTAPSPFNTSPNKK